MGPTPASAAADMPAPVPIRWAAVIWDIRARAGAMGQVYKYPALFLLLAAAGLAGEALA